MTDGKVQIHGKTYLTVAYRVNEFRKEHPDWGILTDIVESNDEIVIMKSTITSKPGCIIGTGYAEEKRGSTQINRTSALENCETSAIGRALAACGYGGTEYASANEVQNAIQQQVEPNPINMKKVTEAAVFFKAWIDKDVEDEEKVVPIKNHYHGLTNDERIEMAKLLEDKAPDTNKMYKNILKGYLEMKV